MQEISKLKTYVKLENGKFININAINNDSS